MSETSNLEDGMRTWLGGVATQRSALETERKEHQQAAITITKQIAELDRTERRYKIALGMSPARPQRKPAPAASEAMRADAEEAKTDAAPEE